MWYVHAMTTLTRIHSLARAASARSRERLADWAPGDTENVVRRLLLLPPQEEMFMEFVGPNDDGLFEIEDVPADERLRRVIAWHREPRRAMLGDWAASAHRHMLRGGERARWAWERHHAARALAAARTITFTADEHSALIPGVSRTLVGKLHAGPRPTRADRWIVITATSEVDDQYHRARWAWERGDVYRDYEAEEETALITLCVPAPALTEAIITETVLRYYMDTHAWRKQHWAARVGCLPTLHLAVDWDRVVDEADAIRRAAGIAAADAAITACTRPPSAVERLFGRT